MSARGRGSRDALPVDVALVPQRQSPLVERLAELEDTTTRPDRGSLIGRARSNHALPPVELDQNAVRRGNPRVAMRRPNRTKRHAPAARGCDGFDQFGF